MSKRKDWTPPLVFVRLAEYCERQGWVPVGHRRFRIGKYAVRVNGAGTTWDGVPPYSALIEDPDTVSVMIVDPSGGSAAGLGALDAFERDVIAAFEAQR